MAVSLPALLALPYRLKFEEVQPLSEVIVEHDITLLDTCVFTGSNELADRLYDATTLPKLNKIAEELESEQTYVDWLLTSVIFQPGVTTIPAVLEELRYFQFHVQESSSFHQRLWNRDMYDSISGKFLSCKKSGSPVENSMRRIRKRNNYLEHILNLLPDNLTRGTADSMGYRPQGITLLSKLNDNYQTLRDNIELYTGPIIPIEGVDKASITDCTLVGAALGASAAHYNDSAYCVALITKDHDIPFSLKRFLATDQHYPALFSNIHIYFSSQEQLDQVKKVRMV